ncbi:hypothetical protein DFH09DRAFT_1130110 [Mycena vulgaris]|nr:hypothetical protein DFH09DRAFT_1130110 [Mycena vulgaris]
MAAPSEHYLAVLKASYDYDPDPGAEDEISIKENQILFLKERVDQDWWRVKVKGESQEEDSPVGLVPAAYVEPADHTSVVKALYDYEASAPGELSITEDQVLLVFDTEEDWLLVQTDEDGGKAGFVPANYVEATSAEEEAPAPQIVVPSSPPKPAYVDPAARVASSKIKADDIKTWSVSEVDKKGKKKKGTLGVGNGAVFFASEADKTPVQKWQTIHIQNINVEKSKHVHIDVGGPNPINLHFSVGSKDNADAIVTKLESSKQLSAPSPASSPPPEPSTPPRDVTPPKESKKASVHFAPESPTVIPVSDDEEEPQAAEEEADAEEEEGDVATALYDFNADGADELSVAEGERLLILERDGDEWWKCRNEKGREGVVPASYLESASGSHPAQEEPEPEQEEEPEEEVEEVDDGAAAREAEERSEALRVEKAKEKERKEKERAKLEAQQRAKAAAVSAELERKKRKAAAAAATARAEAASPPPASRAPPEPEAKKPESKPSSSSRTSLDPAARPPPERVRVWHDRSGQFRVDAAFLGFHGGKLRLHKTNGVIVEVPAEKMSVEDMRYVEKVTSKKSRTTTAAAPPPRVSDDDVPLAISAAAKRASTAPSRKAPTVDWFDFFLSAGCDLDDCTRYAASFERDKIDESILPDITDATMRSLGLREGDIIRVTKAIDKRRPQEKKNEQGEESSGLTKSPPNLFTSPGGALKNPRRGRPQPSKSLPASVDLQAISTVSDQIQRTSSPQTLTPTTVQPPPRSSSALVPAAPAASGFEDDAWTNRPSSAQPLTAAVSTPPIAAPRPPSAPPAAAVPASAPAPAPAPVAPPQPPAQPVVQTPPSLAQTTESDVFNQLARLSALRSQTPQAQPQVAPTPPAVNTPPVGYVSGLGMGSSPVPMGQHLNNQRTGILPQPSPQPQPQYNGPRGPFAPVPANQNLLQPLIPTQTGFNSFIPTRPGAATSPFANPPMQPSFLSAQPTGFPGHQPLQSQPTGFPGQQPMSFQPTGAPFGGFNGTSNGFVQSNPTGFGQPPFNNGQQSFNNGQPPFNNGQSPFNNNQSPFNNPSQFNNTNGFSSPPPVPPLPSSATNTTPANIFAQMKSGTFGAEDNAPQASDRYDALRPNPMVAQATGWGGSYQGGGYGGYH